MAKPYHIIATPDENGYTITIPEYPNATTRCERTADITETGENFAMLARMDAGNPRLPVALNAGKSTAAALCCRGWTIQRPFARTVAPVKRWAQSEWPQRNRKKL